MKLTTPKDLVKPESQVDLIVEKVQAAFEKKPKMHAHNTSVYYIVTIDGGYSPEDIKKVIALYTTEGGWKSVETYRAYETRQRQKLIFTKLKFYETL